MYNKISGRHTAHAQTTPSPTTHTVRSLICYLSLVCARARFIPEKLTAFWGSIHTSDRASTGAGCCPPCCPHCSKAPSAVRSDRYACVTCAASGVEYSLARDRVALHVPAPKRAGGGGRADSSARGRNLETAAMRVLWSPSNNTSSDVIRAACHSAAHRSQQPRSARYSGRRLLRGRGYGPSECVRQQASGCVHRLCSNRFRRAHW